MGTEAGHSDLQQKPLPGSRLGLNPRKPGEACGLVARPAGDQGQQLLLGEPHGVLPGLGVKGCVQTPRCSPSFRQERLRRWFSQVSQPPAHPS